MLNWKKEEERRAEQRRKRNQTQAKLWRRKRAYKLMKGTRRGFGQCLGFPLNWNAWMNESMNEGRQRNNYNTQHMSWTELSFFFLSLGQHQSRVHNPLAIVCVSQQLLSFALYTHTHTPTYSYWLSGDTHKKREEKNELGSQWSNQLEAHNGPFEAALEGQRVKPVMYANDYAEELSIIGKGCG